MTQLTCYEEGALYICIVSSRAGSVSHCTAVGCSACQGVSRSQQSWCHPCKGLSRGCGWDQLQQHHAELPCQMPGIGAGWEAAQGWRWEARSEMSHSCKQQPDGCCRAQHRALLPSRSFCQLKGRVLSILKNLGAAAKPRLRARPSWSQRYWISSGGLAHAAPRPAQYKHSGQSPCCSHLPYSPHSAHRQQHGGSPQ